MLIVTRSLQLLIKLYQFIVSPLFGGACRFHPSCSNYAQQAIGTHGPLKGLALSFWRVLRCNPLCSGGEDLVPQVKFRK